MATVLSKSAKTYTVTFNPNSEYASALMNAIILSRMFVVEESPYDPAFVQKIKHAKNSKGVAIKTEDLWK